MCCVQRDDNIMLKGCIELRDPRFAAEHARHSRSALRARPPPAVAAHVARSP